MIRVIYLNGRPALLDRLGEIVAEEAQANGA